MKKNQIALIIDNRRNIVVSFGVIYDIAVFLSAPFVSIKNKNFKSFFNREYMTVFSCLFPILAAYIIVPDIRKFWVFGIAIFVLLLYIDEAIYLKFFEKIKRYDPEHNIYRSKTHPYGDRRFMTMDEKKEVLIRSKNINTFDGIILGKDKDGYMVSLKENLPFGNLNMTVVGNSGTMKGVSIVIPRGLQIIKSGKSGVIASTKDDNFALLAWIAKKSGYLIRVFTLRPGEFDRSDGIDFMKLVNNQTDIAITVAHCILKNTSVDDPRQDYWFKGEQDLLYSLILYFSNLGGTLTDVYFFILKGLATIETELNMLPENHPAYGPFRIFAEGGETAKAQVIQGLGFRFATFLADPEIQEMLRHDDIDFRIMDKKKCLYFVIFSDKTDVYRALSSTFFSLMFFTLGDEAGKNHGTLKRKVEVVIDEAFACGSIPNYAHIISTSRGYGINITTIIQSLPQLKSMYGEEAKSILNDSGVKILVHTDDIDTAEYFSTLAGIFTGENATYDKTEDKSGSREASIPLLSVSDIISKDIDEIIVHITGTKNPTLKLKKQKWYDNWPGSNFEFFNEKDGRTYKGHPLLAFYKSTPINRYKPVRYRNTVIQDTVKPIESTEKSLQPIKTKKMVLKEETEVKEVEDTIGTKDPQDAENIKDTDNISNDSDKKEEKVFASKGEELFSDCFE